MKTLKDLKRFHCDDAGMLHREDGDWLLAESVEAIFPKWISVDDYFPEDYQSVVIRGGFGFRLHGMWYTYLEHNGNSYSQIQWEVTHWMSLPNFPETYRTAEFESTMQELTEETENLGLYPWSEAKQ